MADINAIAKQFTDFYYATFDSNRSALQSLYVCTLFSPWTKSNPFAARYIDAHV